MPFYKEHSQEYLVSLTSLSLRFLFRKCLSGYDGAVHYLLHLR